MGIISNIPLPSNYLHYYWKNAEESDNYRYVIRRLNETKQTILTRQYSKGIKAISRQYTSSGLFSAEDLAMLDAKYSNFNVVDLAEAMSSTSVDVNKGVRGAVSADASFVLEAWFQLRESLKEGADFQENLQKIVMALRTTSPGLVKEIESYIIANYQSVQSEIPQSETLTKMVKSLLAKPNGTLRPVDPQNTHLSNLKKVTLRFMLLVYALGSDIDTSTKESIENGIRRLGIGQLTNIQGDLGELARLTIGAMNDEMAGTMLSQLNQMLETTLTGGQTWSAECHFDPLLTSMLRTSQKNSASSKKTMRFDENGVSFSQTQQKSDKTIITNMGITIGGIQVKTTSDLTIKDEVGTVAMQELKLQDKTPLITVLARHLGFQGQTIKRLLQIAVADPEGNGTLDAYWEGLQRQVEYGIISDALIGYGGQTKNVVMQINNTFIPMEDFFSYIVNGLSLTGEEQINIHASGFPSRSVFTSLNKWDTSKTAAPNTYSGIIRSNKLYPQALGALYDAKITIKLRQFIISDLVSVMF